MSCELWRVSVHLLQVICHCFTCALFITSPLISPPLSTALCKTPTLRLRNERNPLSLLPLPLVDDMSLPWGIQDEDNLFLPFILAVLAPWCQAYVHARSANLFLLQSARGLRALQVLERTQSRLSVFSEPVIYSEDPSHVKQGAGKQWSEGKKPGTSQVTHTWKRPHLPLFSTGDQPVTVFSACVSFAYRNLHCSAALSRSPSPVPSPFPTPLPCSLLGKSVLPLA